MILVTLCFIFAITMFIKIHYSNDDNPNGISISIFQKIIGLIDFILCRYKIMSILSFSINPKKSNPKEVEKIVWLRLCTVSVISLVYELFFPLVNQYIEILLLIYLTLLQVSMVNSLLKPLFGVKRTDNKLTLNQNLAKNLTVNIPAPKRSLLLAFVNLFEIIITWAIIYRLIMPTQVNTITKAIYFSIVTITTLGYGDINGNKEIIEQLAITFNMIVFVLFSICHITTILGTLANNDRG